MAFTLNLQDIRAVPKLYLFDFVKLDSASTYASLIQVLYEGFCFATPRLTKLSLCGEYHCLRSEGCYLELDKLAIPPVPNDYGGYQGFITWLFAQSRAMPVNLLNSLLPFEGLALVIYLSEWCAVDISTSKEHFRQTFYQGQAVTPCERRSVNDLPKDAPFIQLQFMLACPQFNSRLVTPEQIRQAFSSLRRHRLIPKNLRLTAVRGTDNGFEGRIKLIH